jgi:transcriptional regulator with XRE-family HTH domain
MKTNSLTLSAAQVQATIKALNLTHQEFAEQVGCGASQMWKYQSEGLPPRMNREVRANILDAAAQAGIITNNSATRATVTKLSKGQKAPSGDSRQRLTNTEEN